MFHTTNSEQPDCRSIIRKLVSHLHIRLTRRRMVGMSPFIQNCSHDGLSMGNSKNQKKLGIRNDKVMEREMAAAASITLTHNERQHTLMITYNTTTHAYIRRTAIFWLDGCVLVMTRAKRMNERIWMERNQKNRIRKNARSTTDKTQIEAISPWQKQYNENEWQTTLQTGVLRAAKNTTRRWFLWRKTEKGVVEIYK